MEEFVFNSFLSELNTFKHINKHLYVTRQEKIKFKLKVKGKPNTLNHVYNFYRPQT